ncbi:hypothetical protein GCM10008942_10620 [Rhizomicrobium electricum]|uniref:Lipoprotein n=1 Tax=Rhizomicrobium electricum TaxID=480070 RepID=A0ABN1ED37_9PROT|nr:hypothetical protein [Rhizomicrobium electricum]
MKNFIAMIVVGALGIGCADGPGPRSAVRDAETAIRIGVNACISNYSQPPRKDLHAKYNAGIWHVWWGNQDGRVFTFSVNVYADTGAAGLCAVGTN